MCEWPLMPPFCARVKVWRLRIRCTYVAGARCTYASSIAASPSAPLSIPPFPSHLSSAAPDANRKFSAPRLTKVGEFKGKFLRFKLAEPAGTSLLPEAGLPGPEEQVYYLRCKESSRRRHRREAIRPSATAADATLRAALSRNASSTWSN